MEITKVEVIDNADKLTVKDLKKAAKKLKIKPKAKPVPPKPQPNKKYDEAIHPQFIIDHLAEGNSVRSLISKLQISPSTWQDWRNRYQAVKEAVEAGKSASEQYYIDQGKKLITGQMKGSAAMLCFFLKNLHGWKDVNDQQSDPAPITINFGIAAKPDTNTPKKES